MNGAVKGTPDHQTDQDVLEESHRLRERADRIRTELRQARLALERDSSERRHFGASRLRWFMDHLPDPSET